MRFYCNRMEDLALGDRCGRPNSFDAKVLRQGIFDAKIKRTGSSTVQLGIVELLLIETKPGTERLAVCCNIANSNDCKTLIFPLIKGTEFGIVKRHGNVLTLYAVRFNLILEATFASYEGDSNLVASTGQWARILSRLVSGSTSNITMGSSLLDQTPVNSFNGGLGISVPPVNQGTSPVLTACTTNSSCRPRQLVPKALQETVIPKLTSTGDASMPRSRSLKRVSLCLQKNDGPDVGFGDDLFSVLAKMDSASPEPEPETFALPTALFNDSQGSDLNITPSPNSLYLQTDASFTSLDTSTGKSTKRINTILAKEQQQYVENYGLRAPALSTYLDMNSSSASPIKCNSIAKRKPPQIPAPVVCKPEVKSDSVKTSGGPTAFSNESFSKTCAPAPHLTTSLSANRLVKSSSMSNSKKNVCSESSDSEPPSRKKAVSVAIDPNVYVINDDIQENSEESNGDNKNRPDKKTNAKTNNSRRMDNKVKFSKVVKRLLGKRKTKETKHLPDEHVLGESKSNHTPTSPNDRPSSPISEKLVSDHQSPNTPDKNSSGDDSIEKPAMRVSLPTPEQSPPVRGMSQEKISKSSHNHHYHNLARQKSPVSILDGDNDQQPKRIFIANASENGGQTAAVPKLKSSSSIEALSFRSYSSKSLSLESIKDDVKENNVKASDSEDALKEQVENSKSSIKSKSDLETVPELGSDVSSSFLKRESHDTFNPVPVKINETDLETLFNLGAKSEPKISPRYSSSTSAPRKMYESESKSTSALQPSKSSSFSSFSSSKRSYTSSASSVSSASSLNTLGLMKHENNNDTVNLFAANMWISVWDNSRWNPVSQLELRTEVVATNSSATAEVVVSGGTTVNFCFTSQCKVRKVGHHDVEVKSLGNTYMFRGRDAENAQRFYRTLWTIQANGVQPVVVAAMSSAKYNGIYNNGFRTSFCEDEELAMRRRISMPPILSKNNLTYMGRAASTIIEE